ncbi:MAG TPA: hypothetical protein VFI15_02600 [Candidatus Limnocylindrales bacterium]|nr:hypothetical protein [Candidatus Limnocylindrales bacterium]
MVVVRRGIAPICALLVAAAIWPTAIVAGPGTGNGGIVDFAWGQVDTDLYDGIKGNQSIRTNPATLIGQSFVHGAQVIMPGLVDFVAVGTVKGKGAAGCTSHYDPHANWSGYFDGKLNGVYFCGNFFDSFYVTGDNPSFQILYTSCNGTNQWKLDFAGGTRHCTNNGHSQGVIINGMMENDGNTTDHNLDVKYTNMMKNHPGSTTWSNMGDTRPGNADPFYTYQYVSTTAFNLYLAPLD